nr:MAG TPA: hypothetical protein [Caudoviricetes sp.]
MHTKTHQQFPHTHQKHTKQTLTEYQKMDSRIISLMYIKWNILKYLVCEKYRRWRLGVHIF